jgi:hypothetical protein
MKDGSKSTDHEPPKQAKKKASGDAKPSGKKSEPTIKAGKGKKVAEAPTAGKKGGAGAAKSKKSDDDLDIESEGSNQSEALEASD